MLTYSLEKDDAHPLYLQIYEKIKNDILCGDISCSEKLPSKRLLAKHLNISVITVQNAYEQLLAEGYIYSVEKKGYYAAELQTRIPTKPPEDDDAADSESQASDDGGGIFPFSTWAKLMRRVIMEQSSNLIRSPHWNGVPELRRAISDYLREFRGMSVSPNQIIVGAGTEYLYSLIIQLLGRSKIFAVENPGYPKLRQILSANDVSFVSVPIDKYGLSASELGSSNAQVLHISPAHHYPTGTVMPIARRQALLNWARENSDEKSSRYIIEDDYDSEFRYKGKPIPTVFSIDNSDRVIYTNTFSKSISPSMRISYMVLPPPLLKLYREKLSFYSCTVPSFEQYTLAEFISDGYFERHINRAKKYYRQKRDAVTAEIMRELELSENCIFEADSGLHFLIRINDKRKIDKLRRLAQRLNLKLADINSYCVMPTKVYTDTIVVGYQSAIIPQER